MAQQQQVDWQCTECIECVDSNLSQVVDFDQQKKLDLDVKGEHRRRLCAPFYFSAIPFNSSLSRK